MFNDIIYIFYNKKYGLKIINNIIITWLFRRDASDFALTLSDWAESQHLSWPIRPSSPWVPAALRPTSWRLSWPQPDPYLSVHSFPPISSNSHSFVIFVQPKHDVSPTFSPNANALSVLRFSTELLLYSFPQFCHVVLLFDAFSLQYRALSAKRVPLSFSVGPWLGDQSSKTGFSSTLLQQLPTFNCYHQPNSRDHWRKLFRPPLYAILSREYIF